MASLMGMNARRKRFSELEFYWDESGQYVIPLESQYQLGFKKTNSALTISALTSGDEENVMSVGSGYGITFANQYMTQERLESLFEKINGFTYTPATLKWRGDPSLEVCDIPVSYTHLILALRLNVVMNDIYNIFVKALTFWRCNFNGFINRKKKG